MTLTASGTVDPATLPTTIISNTATVTAPGGVTDPDPSDNSATDSNPFTVDADLSVDKSAAPSTVIAGQSTIYTIDVSNAGAGAATDVAVVDMLPAGVTFSSAVVSGGSGGESCGHAAGVVSCALDSISSGATETITITVDLDPATLGVISNSAVVTATSPDPDLSNNDDTADVTVTAESDLSLTKTVTPTSAGVGAALTYTIVVSASGPSHATNVVVTDPIPSGVAFNTALSTQGSCSIGASLTCSIGTMAPGSSVTITINATGTTDGTVVNTASVASSASDPTLSNNSDSASVTLTGVGSIRSLIWWDVDKDAVIDSSEPRLGGVTVRLYDGGGAFVAATTTNLNGQYSFSMLDSGAYEVRVDETTVPAGALLVSDPQGASDGIATTSVITGVETTGLDFGYAGTSKISGTVFHDIDGDDSQVLPFEPGIPFVDVTVTWAGPDGTLGTTDDVDFNIATGGFGEYEADCVPAGAYRITVDESSLPRGLEVTTNDHPANRSVGVGGSAIADFGAAGNSAPIAVDDASSTPQAVPVAVAVLGNDSDPEGDPITVTDVGSPSNGSVTLNLSGQVVYTPDATFAGVDTFVYTIEDEKGDTDTAVVTITVTSVNTPPVYEGPPQVTVDPGADLPDPPIGDPDGDDLTIEIVEGDLPSGVELVDGQLIGSPTDEGSFTVVYRICDNSDARLCSLETVTYLVGDLPYSGSNSMTHFQWAMLLLVVGAWFVVLSRRREGEAYH